MGFGSGFGFGFGFGFGLYKGYGTARLDRGRAVVVRVVPERAAHVVGRQLVGVPVSGLGRRSSVPGRPSEGWLVASEGLGPLPRRRGSALAHGCGRSGRGALPLPRAAVISTRLRVRVALARRDLSEDRVARGLARDVQTVGVDVGHIQGAVLVVQARGIEARDGQLVSQRHGESVASLHLNLCGSEHARVQS